MRDPGPAFAANRAAARHHAGHAGPDTATPVAPIPPQLRDISAARADFVRLTAAKYDIDPAYIESVLAKAQTRDGIIAAMSRPAEAKPWRDYRPIFITQGRIDGGKAFMATQPRCARARRSALRRAGGNHHRDHRRGNQLRRQQGQLSGHRCAVHARLQLSAHRRSGEGRAREPARSLLPRRARPVLRARQGNRHGHHAAQGQLCRRDGLGPVHAVELSPVRGRWQQRRQARPVRQHRRCHRVGRQLFRRRRAAGNAAAR